jgi:hypothetical protein
MSLPEPAPVVQMECLAMDKLAHDGLILGAGLAVAIAAVCTPYLSDNLPG